MKQELILLLIVLILCLIVFDVYALMGKKTIYSSYSKESKHLNADIQEQKILKNKEICEGCATATMTVEVDLINFRYPQNDSKR